MEPADRFQRRKVTKVPPVPIKTYKWEDVRRSKRKGEYPWTHLYKGPYTDQISMEEIKETKSSKDSKSIEGRSPSPRESNPLSKTSSKENVSSDGEKKKRVRKVKRTSTVKVEKEVEKDAEHPNEILVEIFEKMEVEETKITLKELPEEPSERLTPMLVDKPVPEKTEIKAHQDEKDNLAIVTEQKELSIESPTDEDKEVEIIFSESDKLSTVKVVTEPKTLTPIKPTDEDKEIETLFPDSDKLITTKVNDTNDSNIPVEEIKLGNEDDQKTNEDKVSADISAAEVISKAESKNTESEDTYTESNIEQYLDKDKPSKSVSDASGMEANTSVSDIEFVHDNKPLSSPTLLDPQADKKRKHSDLSEMTKSNLSLFEKMKKAKFKAPTFKIPKFKKLTFSKRNSKKLKVEPKEPQTKIVARTDIKQQRRESPVYIYIPLNPTPEQLEQERLTKLGSESSINNEPVDDNNRLNDTKDTNGRITTSILSETTPKTVDIKSVSSKWKSKTNSKKSPPVKKKASKPAKKISPKTEKKTVEDKIQPPVKQRDDSPPVDYIYIPLNPSEEELALERARTPVTQSIVNGETNGELSSTSLDTSQSVTEIESSENVNKTTETVKQLTPTKKESPKGAIKKKSIVKNKKTKDSSTSKLSKDLKKFALKLKIIQKKSLKDKKTSVKTSPKSEQKLTSGKKTSPKNKRGDSPEYIFIPLKDPLPDDLQAAETVKENIVTSAEAENKSDETIPLEITEVKSEKPVQSKVSEENILKGTEVEEKTEIHVQEKDVEIKTEDAAKPKETSETDLEINVIESREAKLGDMENVEVNIKVEELSQQETKTTESSENKSDDSKIILESKKLDEVIKSDETSVMDETDESSKIDAEKETLEQKPPESPKPVVMQEAILKPIFTKQMSKEPEPKKESLLTRMTSIKKSPKQSVPAKKTGVKPLTGKKTSPTSIKKSSPTSNILHPAVRHKDSIVEYIYIPLNPTEEELAAEEAEKKAKEEIEAKTKKGKQAKSDVKQIEIKDDKKQGKSLDNKKQDKSPAKEFQSSVLTKEELEIVRRKLEKQAKRTEQKLEVKDNKKRDKSPVQDFKDNILSKFKGMKHKSDKKSPPSKKKKVPDEPTKPEKKVIKSTANEKEDSSQVEFIHIPLKSAEEELDTEKEQKEHLHETEKLEIPTEDDKVKSPVDETTEEKEDVIKLTSIAAENTEPATLTITSADSFLKSDEVKESEQPKNKKDKKSIMAKLKGMKHDEKEKTDTDTKIPTEESLILEEKTAIEPAESLELSELEQKELTKEVDLQSVNLEEPETPSDITVSDKPLEVTTTTVSSQSEQKTEETKEQTVIKQSVVSKWKGLKQQKPGKKSPPNKKKSAKKISPKSEKKTSIPREKIQPPVVVRRGDSPPVDYIYIPLNPTEEELAAEKEREEKLVASKKSVTPTRTPEISHKPVVVKAHKKEKLTGAIKKQPTEKQEKEKKPKEKSKLAEDIKKFAAKLKEMKNKSKKPTFKTFKRGSKVGSKKLSPTTSKKPVGTEEKRSLPHGQKRGDSPVEYIFIPLKPTEEELAAEEATRKAKEELPTSLPTSEEPVPVESITKHVQEPKDETVTSQVVAKETEEKSTEKKEDVPKTSSSPFSTLKKTKEMGKNKLKALKDAVQPPKEKKEKDKKVKKSEKPTKVEKKSEDKPDTAKKDTPEEISSEDTKTSIPTEIESKPEPVETSKEEEDDHHYEPISMEDKEDGLKTVVVKEPNLTPEEQALKSSLKTEDSPKMHKKVSFKMKKKPKDKETNGLETTDNNNDDNVIYETIQIQGEQPAEGGSPEDKEKQAQPSKSVDGEAQSTSLEDDRNKWSKSNDHEYEPINPPPEPEAVAPASVTSPPEAPPPVHVTTQRTDLEKPTVTVQPPTPQPLSQPQLLRIPLDTDVIVASADLSEPESERTHSRADTASPGTQATNLSTVTPHTTLSSRTEGISTSQVDSSTLERLPLKKENRKKKVSKKDNMDEQENQGPNFQDKFKAQAGKIKTKLKGIKKPTFTIPNPKFKRPQFERPKFNAPKFERPKFNAPKFSAPKFTMPTMPKMPERPKINFPSFSIPRPGSMRRQRSAEDKHISTTESSADSKKNIFDFRTYPRLFDKAKKKKGKTDATTPGSEETPSTPEFATVPRAAARKKGPVGARWVHRFADIKFADDETKKPSGLSDELSSKDRGDSLERRMKADLRYELALADMDDDMREYDRENQEIHRASPYNADNMEYTDRWRHGSFRRRHEYDDDMRNDMETEEINLEREEYEMRRNPDEHSSVASSGHRGVIEEIDSDQFFLREKGISQDNIQVGLYLSSEIRDAFKQPVNALSQMEDGQHAYGSREYDLDASDLSLARPSRPKRKHLKKTKKIKKTPHASNENVDQESVNTETEEYLPPRPRRNKKQKVLEHEESLDISQGEMPIDDEVNLDFENLKSQEDLPGVDNDSMPNIIGYVDKDLDVLDEYDKYINDENIMYENEVMQNIEQPEIIINANQKYEIEPKEIDKYLEETGMVGTPKPPTRRHKSLKSLNLSEHDSILGEFNKDKFMQDMLDQELNVYRVEREYQVPSDESHPIVPTRRNRSRSRTESQVDDDRTSHGGESLTFESECIEPPCVKDMRDAMGYAIIDKSGKNRDPPLPPAPRRNRSRKSSKSPSEAKFFTVPRQLNDETPVRPIRNYSTLGPSRPPRNRSKPDLTEDEEKENIDISQYIEIEDEDHNKDLQSGEIINKMKGRPLPAPPRPPRKGRDRSKEALRDITQQSNIISDVISEHEKTLDISPASPAEAVEEIEVSTQTDPLPDDFCCEEIIEEPTDRIVAPSRRKRSVHSLSRDSSIPRSQERPKTPLERAASPSAVIIERQVHTPIEDETITHASLLVRPVPEYPPDSYVSKRFGADIPDMMPNTLLSDISTEREIEECIIKSETKEISREPEMEISDESTLVSTIPPSIEDKESIPLYSELNEQVPEIPEKPLRRKSQAQIPPQSPQPQIIERIIEKQVPVCITPGPDTEVEILKAQRLQVSELDVDRLNVSELQAHKILVSEIDGVSLQISELSSKSGNLIINGLEFPSGFIQEILDKVQSTSQTQQPSPSTEQVSTQTSLEEPEPNNTKEFAESPITEQVATQTSIEIPDEKSVQPPPTEQVATQTSVEIPEESVAPEEFNQLTSEPEFHTQADKTDESIVPEEFAELSNVTAESSEIPIKDMTEDEQLQALENIKERIRFIEEEMNEFISDITPDDRDALKSEIDAIIDIASEHVSRSRENLQELMEMSEHPELYMQYPMLVTDSAYDDDDMPSLEQEIIFLPQGIIVSEIPGEFAEFGYMPQPPLEEIIEESSDIVTDDTTTETKQDTTVKKNFETQAFTTDDQKLDDTQSLTTDEKNIEIHVSETQQSPVEEKKLEFQQFSVDEKKAEEKLPVIDKKKVESNLTETDSIVPKEFSQLKSEQETIMENIQKELKNETQTPSSKTQKELSEHSILEHTESLQSNISSSTPPRPPLPEHDRTEYPLDSQLFHEAQYPLYFEYESLPPPTFYSLRQPQPQSLPEEDIPVHHRRRRHLRSHHSRSSSDEDTRRPPSRRRTTRSPDPSIPELSGQLARACTISGIRFIKELFNYISSHLGTRQGKHDLQIAMVILLVLIVGLILIGFQSGKTVHLHHWEYFNPPKEL